MATNINQFLFTRTKPQTKLEVINNLTDQELLSVTSDTIIRIIKEVGCNRRKGCRDKELYISSNNRAGNHWDSSFEGIDYYKGKLIVYLYVQYENTDTTTSETYYHFMRDRNYEGTIHTTDYRGNPRSYYFTYDQHDRAECIKSILREYITVKYADKLKAA